MDDIRMRIILGVGGFEAIDRVTSAIRGVGPAASAMAGQVNKAGDAANRNIGLFGRLSEKLEQTEKMYDRVFRAGFQLQLAGGMINDIGERGIEILGGAVDAYRDYDVMLRRAGTALNTNTEWQGRLDKAIQQTAKAVGLFSPEEVAEAYYYWGAAAGVVVDNSKDLAYIQETVEKVLVATAAAGGDLESNLKGVYGILSVYNLGADRAGDVTEKLAFLTERTAADFGDLTSAFTYVGPLAASLGVTFEDTAQVLGVLADAGQRGSRAGRGFSMIMEGLSAPSIKAEEALMRVAKATGFAGDEWKDFVFPEGKFIGMRELVMKLAEGMEDMTDAERGYILSTGFTNNATRALIPLIEEQIALNKENAAAGRDMTSVLDQQKYSLGSASEFYAQMNENMTSSINAVIGSLQNTFFPIIQKIATEIMRLLIPAIDWLKGAFDTLNQVLEDNPGLTTFIVAAGAVISIVALVGGAILSTVGTFLVLKAAIATVIPVLGIVASAALPVVAAIAAIIAIAAVLYVAWTENWFGIQQIVGQAVSFIQGVLAQVSTFINTTVIPAVQRFAADVQTYFDGTIRPIIEKVMTALGNILRDVVIPALQQLGSFIQTVVIPAFQAAAPIIAAVIGKLFELHAAIFGMVIPVLAQIVDWLIANVGPAFATVMGIIGEFVGWLTGSFIPAVIDVWNQFTGALQAAWNFTQDAIAAITSIFVAVRDTATQVWNAISTAVKIATDVITTVLKAVVLVAILPFFTAVKAVDEVAKFFTARLNEVINFLKGPVTAAFNFIRDIVSSVFGAISSTVGSVISSILGVIGSGMNTAKQIFDSTLGAIFGFFRDAVGTITRIVGDIMGGITGGISGGVGQVRSATNKVIDSITKPIRDVIGTVTKIGKDIVGGLWNGIKSMGGWIANQVTSWAKSVLPGPIADVLGIHSPSRVAMELGRYFVQGLAIGFERDTKRVLNSVDALTGAVVARVEAGQQNVGMELKGLTASVNHSFSTDNRKVIRVEVDVTSSDGSVSKVDIDKLREGLGADLVSAIEHAASLD